ncbi:MAG TPA: RNA polymerase sigma factor RpoD/SigA [Polyangiaceae bacterium]
MTEKQPLRKRGVSPQGEVPHAQSGVDEDIPHSQLVIDEDVPHSQLVIDEDVPHSQLVIDEDVPHSQLAIDEGPRSEIGASSQSEGAPTADEGEPPPEVRDILTSYFREAARFRPLTPEDEVALAQRVRTGQEAAARLEAQGIGNVEELRALVADGERARHGLVEANLRLVPFVAKSLRGMGALTREDLVQEGNLGLLRAAERFDGTHGTRFSTYACWWIWSFMKRAVTDRGHLVRLPSHMAERVRAVLRVRAELARERRGTDPSVHDLAERLGWQVEVVMFILQSLDVPLSLDSRVDEQQPTFGEGLAAPASARPDMLTFRHQERGIVNALVDSLGERVAFVLRERFGLTGREPRTLEDIGEELGVSPERIRQIEVEGLNRLRHPAKTRLLQGLLEYGRPDPNAPPPGKKGDSSRAKGTRRKK